VTPRTVFSRLFKNRQGGSHLARINDFLLPLLPLHQQRIVPDLPSAAVHLESSGYGYRIKGGDGISDFELLNPSKSLSVRPKRTAQFLAPSAAL
jgi:hypothetical protein